MKRLIVVTLFIAFELLAHSVCLSAVGDNISSPPPDINNLASACESNTDDPICKTITKALYDFRDFQNRSIEYMTKKANLGLYQKITITGLSMLVNRKIEIKNKSFFSDKINQNFEIRESSAVFSFEYNF